VDTIVRIDLHQPTSIIIVMIGFKRRKIAQNGDAIQRPAERCIFLRIRLELCLNLITRHRLSLCICLSKNKYI